MMAGIGNFWVKRRKCWVDDDPGGRKGCQKKLVFLGGR